MSNIIILLLGALGITVCFLWHLVRAVQEARRAREVDDEPISDELRTDIERGIRDMEEGRTRPWDEAMKDLGWD